MSSTIVTRGVARRSKEAHVDEHPAPEAENQKPRSKVTLAKSAEKRASLAEAKQKMYKQTKEQAAMSGDQAGCGDFNGSLVQDIYNGALSMATQVRFATGIVYDDRFALHRCLWDSGYPECPERYKIVMERIALRELVERCTFIQPREASVAELKLQHTAEQVRILRETRGVKDEQLLEELSSKYDAIFIHPTSYETSLLAVGSTIQLVDSVINGTVQNGMAIVRPPGHHAMTAEYNGYCFFNNVAIATKHALNSGLKKILIVDWDIHHGQGTQQMFYKDPRVLYFSIHRYEHGTFWPHLRESDFDYVGEEEGVGFNFNVPLNATGMTNGDYLAIWHQLLLPVATEFNPDLVILSAGYDSALGDEKGMMEITPAFYAHMLSPLMSLAQGRVAVVLEGGYCLESLAESCAMTLKTLLGDPCPLLLEKLDPPTESVLDSILNCIYTHRKYWKCLQLNEVYSLEEYNNTILQDNLHSVVQHYVSPILPTEHPVRYETRNCYPVQSIAEQERIEQRLQLLHLLTDLTFPATRVCYVYEEGMLEHCNIHDQSHPEQPDRIAIIHQRLEQDYQLTKRMKRIAGRPATTEELCLVHDEQHVTKIAAVGTSKSMKRDAKQFNSVYFHPQTDVSARLAAGSVLTVLEDVLQGRSGSGMCIVRPPGHHAEQDEPHGFCIFNNIAVAAQCAIDQHGLKRVLIVDWDVHHGNGTQHIFENDPRVLYVSLHRYDNGAFYPKSQDANYDVVGKGYGEGFNVNVPWNKKGMSDSDYLAAFHAIVLPVAYEFDPELVLVSAGFDAAIGDPLGGCLVTPEAYGHFTHLLSSLANGRVIVCLEGGYNVNSISHAMAMCGKALLGDPLPVLSNKTGPNPSCLDTIRSVLQVQGKYWKSLCPRKKLLDSNQPLERMLGKKPQIGLAAPLPISELTELLDKAALGKEPEIDLAAPLPTSSSSTGSQQHSQDGASTSNAFGSSDQAAKKSDGTLAEYLQSHLEALQNKEMFAVVPHRNCPHVVMLNPDSAPSAIDTTQLCQDCSVEGENWVCLICFGVYCGRFVGKHMMHHATEIENHPIALSFADLSVWCYACDTYIDHPTLHQFKNLVHMHKFGEPLVWAYGSDLLLEVVDAGAGGSGLARQGE